MDKKIHLWDIASGREIYCFEGHTDYVRCVALSPDGKFALSGSNDQTICLWKVPQD